MFYTSILPLTANKKGEKYSKFWAKKKKKNVIWGHLPLSYYYYYYYDDDDDERMKALDGFRRGDRVRVATYTRVLDVLQKEKDVSFVEGVTKEEAMRTKY